MKSYNSPFVSIIIPTYNNAEFLGKALKSVIDQTYGSWEAIVIDNNSTDETDEVVNKFQDTELNILKLQIMELLQNREILE